MISSLTRLWFRQAANAGAAPGAFDEAVAEYNAEAGPNAGALDKLDEMEQRLKDQKRDTIDDEESSSDDDDAAMLRASMGASDEEGEAAALPEEARRAKKKKKKDKVSPAFAHPSTARNFVMVVIRLRGCWALCLRLRSALLRIDS